jgi:hypothetical protein
MYLILILHLLFSSSVGTTPFFQYQLFDVPSLHVLQEIVIINRDDMDHSPLLPFGDATDP